MREIKAEANTIQDAVEKGLAEIGMRRDQVEVVVLSEGTRGFLGIGAKKACVVLREKKWMGVGAQHGPETRRRTARPDRHDAGRAGARHERRGERPAFHQASRENVSGTHYRRPSNTHGNRETAPGTFDRANRAGMNRAQLENLVFKEEPLAQSITSFTPPEDPLEYAKTALVKILELLGMNASVTEASYDQAQALVFLRFESPQTQFFTNENGRVLQALQFLLNSMLNKNRTPHLALRLDTGNYWKDKEAEIASKVEQAVRTVKTDMQPYSLEPMPPSMRKLVHNLVKSSYPEMETVSEGEGQWRKVVIRPAAPKEEVK